jgi:hypothetical protein
MGYGYDKITERKRAVTWHKTGLISIYAHPWSSGASHNERVGHVVGITMQTHQYDAWVRCRWFDDGVPRCGWLPLRTEEPAPGVKRWEAPPTPSNFVRSPEGGLTFINYKYPITHKLNREAYARRMDPYKPFLRYVEGLRKLQGNQNGKLEFDRELLLEMFPSPTSPLYNSIPHIRGMYGGSAEQIGFKKLALSTDTGDLLKAAIILNQSTYWGESPANTFTDNFLRMHRDEVLTTAVYKGGNLVKDKYRRYFR